MMIDDEIDDERGSDRATHLHRTASSDDIYYYYVCYYKIYNMYARPCVHAMMCV